MKLQKNLITLAAVATLTVGALTGCSSEEANNAATAQPTATTEATKAPETTAAELKDGKYEVKADEADNGYTYVTNMTVEAGKITELTWDAIDENGKKKSELSLNGEYVMTEDGLTWAAQSEALAKYVIENQSVEGIKLDENGKTDVITGVSISVNTFVDQVTKALEKAAK